MAGAAEARVRELEAVARIASIFTFERQLGAVVDEVSRLVVQASGAGLACLLGFGDRSTQMVTRVIGSHGVPPGYAETLEEAWRVGGAPIVSSSLSTRATQVIELAKMVPAAGYEGVRAAQDRAGWGGMAVVPMAYRGVAVGLVIVFYPPGYLPGPAEISFLEAIADQAAVGIENARLFEQAQTVAVDEERQRISRELHDSVSQALYGISLGAQTARELLDLDPASAAEPMEYVLSLAEAGLAEMRAMIFELRPEALASEGLVAAIDRQVTVLRARHAIAVEFGIAHEPAIGIGAKQMLYRVVQEALHNVVKHARASEVRVELAFQPGAVTLTIADNGRGFDPAGSYPGHLGLTSMRERARREGASLAIASVHGAGCTVTVALPCAADVTVEPA